MVRLQLSDIVPNFQELDTSFLKNEATYDWIIDNISERFPLLGFRALKIKKVLFDINTESKKSAICKRLVQHRIDMEWHLSRMYRIRNSIVHDASAGKNIISITANLKYYLIFVVSHIIKILETNASLQSIEDLLALAEEVYNSLEKELFPFEKVLQIETHFDLID